MGLVKRDEADNAGADRQHDGRRTARRQAVRAHQLGIPRFTRTVAPAPRPCPSRATRRRSPTTANALARIAALPRPLVFTNGVFDLLHRGHVTYLEQAKALGASLVVAVNSDASVRRLGKGDDRPLNTLDDRMAVLAALACVDLVVPFDADTPLDLIVGVRTGRAGQGRRLLGGDDGRRRRSHRARRTLRRDSVPPRTVDDGARRTHPALIAPRRSPGYDASACYNSPSTADSPSDADDRPRNRRAWPQLPAADPAHEEGAERHDVGADDPRLRPPTLPACATSRRSRARPATSCSSTAKTTVRSGSS